MSLTSLLGIKDPKHIKEWTSQEAIAKKDGIKREIIEGLKAKEEPQSAHRLVYDAYMNFRVDDYDYDEQHVFAVEALNDLIKDGKVSVAFVKLEHPGGISSLVEFPYIQLINLAA